MYVRITGEHCTIFIITMFKYKELASEAGMFLDVGSVSAGAGRQIWDKDLNYSSLLLKMT